MLIDESDSILYELNFLAKDTQGRMKDEFDAERTKAVRPCEEKHDKAHSQSPYAMT